MNIIEQLQLLVKTGSHTEQTISRYILATLSGAEKLTSTAISKKTHTSQPSIVRFAQALGYTGFTSFKYDLIKCLRSEPAALLPAQAARRLAERKTEGIFACAGTYGSPGRLSNFAPGSQQTRRRLTSGPQRAGTQQDALSAAVP